MHYSTRHISLMLVTMLALGGFGGAAAHAGDDAPLNSKRGSIDIPAENRSLVKELSQIAGKYPQLFGKARIFENMCEASGSCVYVPNWTACCCPSGGNLTCEAWPPE